MTLFSQELRCKPGRADRGVRPYGGYKGCGRRADVGIGPYGGTRGAMDGAVAVGRQAGGSPPYAFMWPVSTGGAEPLPYG